MFDPYKKRIAPKSIMWDRVKRGELMTLIIDLETSGFSRNDVPYSTPASPFITEYGDCLMDLSGNYLNSAQLFPKRPEWLLAQPPAAILQRLEDGLHSYDDPDKDNYWSAIASMAWRIEQSAFAYESMSADREYILFREYNKQLKSGSREAAEEVIPVPLLDDNGEIVHDVRYHPARQKISYRIQREDKDSIDYEFSDNLYYRDEQDGSQWKWVDASVLISGFNFLNYDLPILRTNLMRVGFDPMDSTFLYARGTVNDRQRKKNHILDVRNLAYATVIYGQQDDNGLKMGKIKNILGGQSRRSEALTAYLAEQMKHTNPLRLIQGGAFNPIDGSFPDLNMAHGAFFDAACTGAIMNLSMDTSPWIYKTFDKQVDEKRLYQVLTQTKPQGDTLPLVSLPRRDGGINHSENPYWFLDTDDQMGRFRRLAFLHIDGNFHKSEYKGKKLKDLDAEDWVEYMDRPYNAGDPDRAVIVKSLRRFQGGIPFEDVFKHSSAADHYRKKLGNGDIQKDIAYVAENIQMRENIRAAIAAMQSRMRQNSYMPQNPLLEDELPHLFSGGIAYIEDAATIAAQNGSQDIHPVVKTIHAHHNNDFRYMADMDRAIRRMAIKAHIIDNYKNHAPEDSLGYYDDFLGYTAATSDPEQLREEANIFYSQRRDSAPKGRLILDDLIDPATNKPFFENGKAQIFTADDAAHFKGVLRMHKNMAQAALNSFEGMTDKIHKSQFDKKKWPYAHIIEEIKRPGALKTRYFDTERFGARPKPDFRSPRDAFDFRTQLGLRILRDYDAETRNPASEFISGLVDKTYADKPRHGRANHRLLVADPDNGETGASPHVIDEKGRVLDIAYLKAQKTSHVLDKLSSGEWKTRFYRLRSEPSVTMLMQRFVDLDMGDKIPKPLYEHMYKADLQSRLWGFENETPDTARMTTLETIEFDLSRLELSASMRNAHLLERDRNPLMGAAAKALQTDEGQRALIRSRNWLEEIKAKYPKSPALILDTRHDPASTAPLDYIPFEILRDESKPFLEDPNFVVVDVPAHHLRFPVEQFDIRIPYRGIAVPELAKDKKNAIARGKPLIFREIETGRMYAAGAASVHEKTDKFPILTEKAIRDYAHAGHEISKPDKITYIGIEGLYPLANTRNFEMGTQGFKLPSAQFDALTHPRFAGFGDKPLTSVIIPLDYCPQRLSPDKTLRLREMAAKAFSNIEGGGGMETGHIYDTTLRHVIGIDCTGEKEGVTLADLSRKIRASEISPAIVSGAGFTGVDHLENRLTQWAVERWKDNPMGQRVLVATFDQVNKAYNDNNRDERYNMWGQFNSLSAPLAALKRGGKPVLPSAYQDYGWKPAADSA